MTHQQGPRNHNSIFRTTSTSTSHLPRNF